MGEEKIEIVEVKILDGSKSVGKSVKELSLPLDSILALLIRNGQKPQVPTADTVLEVNDCIVALTTTDSEAILQKKLAGS
jgi:Trk K+ transport system NAD-binding subunit